MKIMLKSVFLMGWVILFFTSLIAFFSEENSFAKDIILENEEHHFSLIVPDNWAIPEEWGEFDAIVVQPDQGDFTPRITVNVIPQSLPVPDEELIQYYKNTEDFYREMFSAVAKEFNFNSVKITDISGWKTINISATYKHKIIGDEILLDQYLIFTGNMQYTLTFSAKKSLWDEYTSIFNTAKESFRIDIPSVQISIKKQFKHSDFIFGYPANWEVKSNPDLLANLIHPETQTNLIVTRELQIENTKDPVQDFLQRNLKWSEESSIEFEFVSGPRKLKDEFDKWSIIEYNHKTPNNIKIRTMTFCMLNEGYFYTLVFSVRRNLLEKVYSEFFDIVLSFQFL